MRKRITLTLILFYYNEDIIKIYKSNADMIKELYVCTERGLRLETFAIFLITTFKSAKLEL